MKWYKLAALMLILAITFGYAADEITITYRMSIANGELDAFDTGTVSYKADQDTDPPARIGGMQEVSTNATLITTNALTTLGWGRFWNRSTNTYVTIGLQPVATYYPFIRLKATESCVVRLEPGVDFYAQAETNTSLLQVDILDN